MIKVVYKGIPDDRKRLYKEHVESGQLNVLLTTYEYIMKDKSSLRKLPWQYIIVDEGHRMKNAQSKFAQILGTVYTSKHRVLLTGALLFVGCFFPLETCTSTLLVCFHLLRVVQCRFAVDDALLAHFFYFYYICSVSSLHCRHPSAERLTRAVGSVELFVAHDLQQCRYF